MSDAAITPPSHAADTTRPSDNSQTLESLQADSQARVASPTYSSSSYTFSPPSDIEDITGRNKNTVTPVSSSALSTLPCPGHSAIVGALPTASDYLHIIDNLQGGSPRARYLHTVPTNILLEEVTKILASQHNTEEQAIGAARRDKGSTAAPKLALGGGEANINDELQDLKFETKDSKKDTKDKNFEVAINRQPPPKSTRHRRSRAIDISPKMKMEQNKQRIEYVVEPSTHSREPRNGQPSVAALQPPALRYNKKHTNVHFDPHVTIVHYIPLTPMLD